MCAHEEKTKRKKEETETEAGSSLEIDHVFRKAAMASTQELKITEVAWYDMEWYLKGIEDGVTNMIFYSCRWTYDEKQWGPGDRTETITENGLPVAFIAPAKISEAIKQIGS